MIDYAKIANEEVKTLFNIGTRYGKMFRQNILLYNIPNYFWYPGFKINYWFLLRPFIYFHYYFTITDEYQRKNFGISNGDIIVGWWKWRITDKTLNKQSAYYCYWYISFKVYYEIYKKIKIIQRNLILGIRDIILNFYIKYIMKIKNPKFCKKGGVCISEEGEICVCIS